MLRRRWASGQARQQERQQQQHQSGRIGCKCSNNPLRLLPLLCSDIYGKRSDYVLKQLWSTLLINLIYGLSNPRIDNW